MSAALGLVITPLVRRFAVKAKVLDVPNSPRRIHTTPIPLPGGLAIFLAFVIGQLVYMHFGHIDFSIIPKKYFITIILGGLTLIVGGVIDDKYNLPPKLLWIFPALASLIVVFSGLGADIKQISNPFGQPFNIAYTFHFLLFTFNLSSILIWLWMMGMIFTTKFLDGLDGLCAGISLIGGLTLFALSLTAHINQPITATLAIIFVGSLFGYLFFAFNPASIFLGEGGSTFLGFMLGVLSIILGGKIATALLVMGIPILDVAWVIIRRLWYRTSPFKADRKHLHFRLLDIGFSQRQTVLILWAISAIFGFVAVFLQTFGKLIALLILFGVMLILALSSVIMYKRKHPHIEGISPVDENPQV